MSEGWDDLPENDDTDNGEPEPQGDDPDTWPEAARAEIAKLRRENAKYRVQRREQRERELVARYGEEAVGLVPAEITDPQRRAQLAEMFAQRLGTAPPPAPEVPEGLAKITAAPAAGGPEASTMSLEEFNKYVEADGLVVAAQKYGHMLDVPNNPLRGGTPEDIRGSYRPPR